MRKVIYGCSALLIAGVGAAYLAADQAARHPTSLVGRCAIAAAQMGARLNPFTMLQRAALPGQAGPLCCEPQPVQPREARELAPALNDVPEEEAPKDEVGEEAPEVIKVEGEAGDPVAPAADPAQDEGCEPQDEDAPCADETCEPARFGAPVQAEPAPQGNGAARAHMPYSDEEEDESGPADAGCGDSHGWLWDFIRKLIPGVPQAGATDGFPQGQSPCPDCHQHQDGCPAAGCPFGGCPYYHGPGQTMDFSGNPGTKPCKPKTAPEDKVPGTESSKAEQLPNPLGLDTLEYRPTDGNAHAFDGLWF